MYIEKKTVGWILLIAGAVVGIISGLVIYTDMQPHGLFGVGYYSYEAPLTSHEIMMIALVVISVIAAIAGIVILYKEGNVRR